MISWLKGQIIQNWHISSKRGVVLNVGGVGYEVQLLSKQIDKIENSDFKEFWIHQINREDCTNLYGFREINQRDLFRKIISINGIGPQIAMVLLQDLEVYQLVNAIEEQDLSLLTNSQGIGKRIAERLVVELKNKLQEFTDNTKINVDNQKSSNLNSFGTYIEEIRSILNSLGYMDNEIKDSIKYLTINEKENTLLINTLSTEAKKELMDKHLKEILIRLSQKST
ncbi:Holliday junction branch migration protein RuvA [Prochlorococcus marinus]|uniref:Holliday junction branch migration complex subunit RuvA n=1 Tax=Prochlorococcus marinus XMU1408 TaxID=2213228 RepID=A0A318R5H4_PROMR|nr:Holliday junction branch migration protein RuvA [Prochlorococcus marinus]MBW3041897.1 Holliday junction branch migration protein RuvA [Prochlorococcus marinus str. XMU1408]PYE03028.1 Holliday junction branch migration protein RuvA [Prochlorococcus marinus XMU1408]